MTRTLKPNEPMKYAAWISPEGKIYSLPREAHTQMAWVICEVVLGMDEDAVENLYRPDDHLLKLKWVKLTSDGNVWSSHNPTITQAQLDALQSILEVEWTRTPPPCIANWSGSGDRYIHGSAELWDLELKRVIYFYGKTNSVV